VNNVWYKERWERTLAAKLRAAVVIPGLVGARTAVKVLPRLIIAEPIAHADVVFRRNAT
jgi:hypothetical protein